MKIFVAPNAFKGSLSASRISEIIRKSFLDVDTTFDVCTCPVSDGGDGFAEVIADNFQVKTLEAKVRNPLGKIISAPVLITKDKTAYIELASASGMRLLKRHELNPLKASTIGTGQLLKIALDNRAEKIVLGIGGSATVDAGTGILHALGVRFLDEQRNEIPPSGGNLFKINKIDISGLDPRIKDCKIEIICDVTNPLIGQNGATKVFAPQKGADIFAIEFLEKGMINLAEIIRQDFNIDVSEVECGGAAGGVSAVLYAFFNARLVAAKMFLRNHLNLESKIKDADIVITGEGRIDSQTSQGKAPFLIAKIARQFNKPVIAICGEFYQNPENVFTSVFSIQNKTATMAEALNTAEEKLELTTHQVAKLIKAFNL